LEPGTAGNPSAVSSAPLVRSIRLRNRLHAVFHEREATARLYVGKGLGKEMLSSLIEEAES